MPLGCNMSVRLDYRIEKVGVCGWSWHTSVEMQLFRILVLGDVLPGVLVKDAESHSQDFKREVGATQLIDGTFFRRNTIVLDSACYSVPVSSHTFLTCSINTLLAVAKTSLYNNIQVIPICIYAELAGTRMVLKQQGEDQRV